MIDSGGAITMVAKVTGDVAAFGVVLGTITSLLPPIAALMSILWIGFQFYNSDPFQKWLAKRKEK